MAKILSSRLASLLLAGATLSSSSSLLAWHGRGHSDVGAIAGRLLARDHHGHALERVRAILGSVTLSQAGPWADCVRKVSGPSAGFHYTNTDVLKNGSHTECYVFSHSTQRHRQMEQYVTRNWSNCPHSGRGCHTQFHFADVALQRAGYAPGEVGVHNHDIVHGINAAVAVLRSEPCNRAHPGTGVVPLPPPAPFHFTCRDALMMLVHLVGDLHQPLHVGSIYLDPAGNRVDPDGSAAARTLADSDGRDTTSTHGGNSLHFGSPELHGHWDETRADSYTDSELNAVTMTTPPSEEWAATWATESVGVARDIAFVGPRFAEAPPKLGPGGTVLPVRNWIVSWPAAPDPNRRDEYDARMARTQHHQIVLAGARLTQLLLSIWPD